MKKILIIYVIATLMFMSGFIWKTIDFETKINEFGKSGWELFHIEKSGNMQKKLFFKRKKTNEFKSKIALSLILISFIIASCGDGCSNGRCKTKNVSNKETKEISIDNKTDY